MQQRHGVNIYILTVIRMKPCL